MPFLEPTQELIIRTPPASGSSTDALINIELLLLFIGLAIFSLMQRICLVGHRGGVIPAQTGLISIILLLGTLSSFAIIAWGVIYYSWWKALLTLIIFSIPMAFMVNNTSFPYLYKINFINGLFLIFINIYLWLGDTLHKLIQGV